MKVSTLVLSMLLLCLSITLGCATGGKEMVASAGAERAWAVHDMERLQPRVVRPGDGHGRGPADAIVLFDGSDLDAWIGDNGNPAGWKIEDGYAEVNGSGGIRTRRRFGDCQLHIEWASPSVVSGESQGRGNSGIHFMGKYEVQVLDSYHNKTYPDGQASAVYGQHPPLVNASRGPGHWQRYDIVFRRPHFDGEGNLTQAGRLTVFHNGILVQDHVRVQGTTAHMRRAGYSSHEDKLPLALQDHGNPVRYRNIWIRELDESK